jgi:hypothetical protein
MLLDGGEVQTAVECHSDVLLPDRLEYGVQLRIPVQPEQRGFRVSRRLLAGDTQRFALIDSNFSDCLRTKVIEV